MKKEKKQLRELSEEELKNVTGGYIQYTDYSKYLQSQGICPEGQVASTDENGQPICVPAEA